ncbi:Uncharacterized conserved protein, DUF305 family [Lentzea albidocapillata subsp. violacea]|uniref:Uncharacterized conserved protein, DUF305 family n=1 Tax=Lentzea albidocapillata subsp. violacea TaxID=128104 RepID=A0A1G9S449_9PSEU|nr:DUF305 domain-containing protein [Lentzea albidocapillata]SDM30338.1 Uncharacterized conserved protein, DUF305 family [Lentzea albidocapillata subsp. violacea]
MTEEKASEDVNWSRRVIALAVGIALLLVGAAAGLTLARPDESAGPTAVDIGFSQDMSVHHLQAVQMANLAAGRSDDADVRQLAFDIASSQLEQVGRMKGWLGMWGEPEQASAGKLMTWMSGEHHSMSGMDNGRMPGMATSEELARLRKLNGKEFDVLFLQLMTRHHEGGISMSKYAADKATVPIVRSLAGAIASSQEAEVQTLKAMLTARNAQPLGSG